jgi:hypothetical protein
LTNPPYFGKCAPPWRQKKPFLGVNEPSLGITNPLLGSGDPSSPAASGTEPLPLLNEPLPGLDPLPGLNDPHEPFLGITEPSPGLEDPPSPTTSERKPSLRLRDPPSPIASETNFFLRSEDIPFFYTASETNPSFVYGGEFVYPTRGFPAASETDPFLGLEDISSPTDSETNPFLGTFTADDSSRNTASETKPFLGIRLSKYTWLGLVFFALLGAIVVLFREPHLEEWSLGEAVRFIAIATYFFAFIGWVILVVLKGVLGLFRSNSTPTHHSPDDWSIRMSGSFWINSTPTHHSPDEDNE